jgi:hypothetical protein
LDVIFLAGDVCELWTMKLDPSYDFAQFTAPTVPVFWNIKSVGTENQDFAIGKPVAVGSSFPGYSDPSVLVGSFLTNAIANSGISQIKKL